LQIFLSKWWLVFVSLHEARSGDLLKIPVERVLEINDLIVVLSANILFYFWLHPADAELEGTIPSLNLLVVLLQSFSMNLLTLITKKAAKNMTSQSTFLPFIFRFQFFEDFVALILFMRRSPGEYLFWVFLAYQVRRSLYLRG
jgi:hypothetical protein